MTRIELTSRVDADGVLRLNVPIGSGEANHDVRVIVEGSAPTARDAPLSQEEWRRFVRRTAGSIQDPTFVRHSQGEYEKREEL
jgi:hypothetical protein